MHVSIYFMHMHTWAVVREHADEHEARYLQRRQRRRSLRFLRRDLSFEIERVRELELGRVQVVLQHFKVKH